MITVLWSQAHSEDKLKTKYSKKHPERWNTIETAKLKTNAKEENERSAEATFAVFEKRASHTPRATLAMFSVKSGEYNGKTEILTQYMRYLQLGHVGA